MFTANPAEVETWLTLTGIVAAPASCVDTRSAMI